MSKYAVLHVISRWPLKGQCLNRFCITIHFYGNEKLTWSKPTASQKEVICWSNGPVNTFCMVSEVSQADMIGTSPKPFNAGTNYDSTTMDNVGACRWLSFNDSCGHIVFVYALLMQPKFCNCIFCIMWATIWMVKLDFLALYSTVWEDHCRNHELWCAATQSNQSLTSSSLPRVDCKTITCDWSWHLSSLPLVTTVNVCKRL